MSRILVPDRGTVRVEGRVSGLLELGAGFQPEYTGRENIFLNASLLGLSRADIKARFDDIVAFAELEHAIDQPLRTYSSGMYMRLGFSVAIHVEPEVLLVDEILAVGDEAFQHKCLAWIEGFQAAGGTIVMVSHNLGAVRQMCDRVAWLEEGRLRRLGPATDVVDEYVDHVREVMASGSGTAASGPERRADVEFGEARLVDHQGRPVSELEPGAWCALEVPFRVRRSVSRPVFGAVVERNDGLLVFATNSHLDGLQVGPLTRDGVVRWVCPSLELLPGSYHLTLALMPSPNVVTPPIAVAGRIPLRVRGAGGEQGIARLDHRWVVENVGSELELSGAEG